jgi:hypothetical protein
MYDFDSLLAYDGEYADLFKEMCQHYRLDAVDMAQILGCQDPFALNGYLTAEGVI